MYNRYIPQPDGSFRRSRIRDTQPPPPPPKQDPDCTPSPSPPSTPEAVCNRPSCPKNRAQRPRPPVNRPERRCDNPGNFLKNLLPKDFDISDLMIVLLLLLMAGDCAEDQNTALLTLALYFFM